jgi:hypothetical protein
MPAKSLKVVNPLLEHTIDFLQVDCGVLVNEKITEASDRLDPFAEISGQDCRIAQVKEDAGVVVDLIFATASRWFPKSRTI